MTTSATMTDQKPNKAPNVGSTLEGKSVGDTDRVLDGEQAEAPKAVPQTRPLAAGILPGDDQPIPDEQASVLHQLQESLGMPLWLFVQGADDKQFGSIDEPTRQLMCMAKHQLPAGKPVALLIHSPGGSARSAYQIACMLRRRCGSFIAVVPSFAKSAGTLLALGAAEIRMSEEAELGPLDTQIHDGESEEWRSALDEIQALERLNAFALETVDRSMLLMLKRTKKKVDNLLPKMLHFASELAKPLLERTDPVRYTSASRALRIAEEYAVRLLQPKYAKAQAQRIANHLVERYPDHGFVIDRQEAESFGLKTEALTPAQNQLSEALMPMLGDRTLLGPLVEVAKP